MTTNEIEAIMQEIIDEGEYEIVAIRTQDEPFVLGEIDHLSHVWVDGEDTGDELDGICASTIRGAKYHTDAANDYYGGAHTAIICGNRYTWGEDDAEVIIEDATVVRIIK